MGSERVGKRGVSFLVLEAIVHNLRHVGSEDRCLSLYSRQLYTS